jgi:hypothetical protein
MIPRNCLYSFGSLPLQSPSNGNKAIARHSVGDLEEFLRARLLCYVGRLLYSHWEAVVAVVTKRSSSCAQFLGIIVELEGVMLHRDVQLGKLGSSSRRS